MKLQWQKVGLALLGSLTLAGASSGVETIGRTNVLDNNVVTSRSASNLQLDDWLYTASAGRDSVTFIQASGNVATGRAKRSLSAVEPFNGFTGLTSAGRPLNPTNLQMLVVVDDSSRLSRNDFQGIYDNIMSQKSDQIFQKAFIIDANDQSANAVAKRKEFNYMLSTSPLNIYTTYVRSQDYASYVRWRPGYEIPTSLANLDALISSMNASSVTGVSKLLKKASSLYDSSMLKVNKILGRSVASKTFTSVLTGLGGNVFGFRLRNNFRPTPDFLGLESNTLTPDAIASALNLVQNNTNVWVSTGNITWGDTAQSSFAWMQATSHEGLFATSEARSVFSRYMQAYRQLLLAQSRLQDAQQRAPVRATVSVRSNESRLPIVSVATDLRGLVETTYTKTYDRIVKSVKPVEAKFASQETVQVVDFDPWNLPQNRTYLAFSVNLEFNTDSAVSQYLPSGPLRALVYPLQRSFYTRLEDALDEAILNALVTKGEQAIASAKACAASSGKAKRDSLVSTPRDIDGRQRHVAKRAGSIANAAAAANARLWHNAVAASPLYVGGVQLEQPSLVLVDDSGSFLTVPLSNETLQDAQRGQIPAFIHDDPGYSSRLPSFAAMGMETTITTPSILLEANRNAVPEGFSLSGTVNLFGKFANASLYTSASCELGSRQVVVPAGNIINVKDLLPAMLASAGFPDLVLQDAQVVYNTFSSATGRAGTWLKGTISLGGLAPKSNDLQASVLKKSPGPLTVEAFLSPKNDWQSLSPPTALSFIGVLPNLDAKFGDLLVFKDADVRISLGMLAGSKASAIYQDVTFSGTVQLQTPNELPALSMRYIMQENNGLISLLLVGGQESTSFFGLPWLKLQDLTMKTSFEVTGGVAAAFDVAASLVLRNTSIELTGYYTQGDWGFSAALDDFTFQDVRAMYEDLFDSPLRIPDLDIEVNNLGFSAGPAGLALYGGVTIDGHTSTLARIRLSADGIEIYGEINNVDIAKDFTLQKAFLDIAVGKASNSTDVGTTRSMKFQIGGEVSVFDSTVKATLFLMKGTNGQSSYTVYGELNPAFNSLGSIAPSLNGSFLDIKLNKACFIASNMDRTQYGSLPVPVQFPIVKGVQIAASLEAVPVFDQAMGNSGAPTVGLALQAMYLEETSGFELRVNLAVAQKMSMKKGTVSSGEVSLRVATAPQPALTILASFYVNTAGSVEPLKFSGGLSASFTSAKLFVEMADYWNNPFNLSPNLRIGPNPALQIGIVYASPVYPSEIGVSGGLAVGAVNGKAALSIAESPNDQLIMMEINNLGVRDLVDFASLMLQTKFPPVEDFVRFRKLSFYLSTGTTIGTTYYPPGASFACDARIFGKDASVRAEVDKRKGTIAVSGALDPIDVGPLSISGVTRGTRANLDVQMGPRSQRLLIDGAVRLASLEAYVYARAELLPTPVFNISSKLAFSSNLDFELQASTRSGSFRNLRDLGRLEFDIYVLFQQDVLDYISREVNNQVVVAKQAIDGGIATAQKNLEAAQAKFDADVQQAAATVATAKAAFEAKVDQVKGALQNKQTQVNAEIDRLAKIAQNGSDKLQAVVDKAQANLKSALEQQVQKVQQAQQAVKDAKQRGDANIDARQQEVTNARNDMNNRFGSALKTIDDAIQTVRNAQSSVDSAQRDVDSAQRDLDNADWYRKPDRAAVLGEKKTILLAKQGALKLADEALGKARAVVAGPGYQAAQAAISTYSQALEAARTAAATTLSAANSALQQTTTQQQQLVDAAQRVANNVKTTSAEAINAVSSAQALATYKSASDTALRGLQAAVDALATSAEKVSFDAATQVLRTAQKATKDVDIAKDALKVTQDSASAVLQASAWVVNKATNLLNIRKAEGTGDLKMVSYGQSKLKFTIVGTFAGKDVNYTFGLTLGKGEELVSDIFRTLVADVKAGVLKIGS